MGCINAKTLFIQTCRIWFDADYFRIADLKKATNSQLSYVVKIFTGLSFLFVSDLWIFFREEFTKAE